MEKKKVKDYPMPHSSDPADFDFIADLGEEYDISAGLENFEPEFFNYGLYPEYNIDDELGITDHIYLTIGIDLRFLKRFNPDDKLFF